MVKHKSILLVDDEENLITGLKRQLRGQFDIFTATSGQEALDIISNHEEFAVVVSDMRMPGMDGVELLGKIKKVSPLTVRMMLTGNADQDTAVRAINSGNIFHFFNKPCNAETFSRGINEGITHYRLLTAEKELIETTLVGSIKQLTEVITLARPREGKRVEMTRRWARKIAKKLNLEKSWELDLAVMLGRIGLVGIPAAVLEKMDNNRRLEASEQKLNDSVPMISADIISHVPRLENVAKAVRYQAKNYDGTGLPDDDVAGDDIPLAARILSVLNGVIDITAGQNAGHLVFTHLRSMKGKFDPTILDLTEQVISDIYQETTTESGEWANEFLPVNLLRSGVTLADDLTFPDGHLILSKGTELSDAQVHRIKGIHTTRKIAEPVSVVYLREQISE